MLSPRFTPSQISKLSYLPSPSYDLSSKPYLPGYIGLNNIKANDYQNVIVHSLLHVPPLRDFFLAPNNPALQPEAKPTELVKRFSELARKVWNPDLFKAQVSPHEFLQEVSVASAGKFKLTEQGDPIEFLGWLLNRLHKDLGGSRKKNSSASSIFSWGGLPSGNKEGTDENRLLGVIYKAFQGDLKVETQQYVVKADSGGSKRPQFDIGRGTIALHSLFLLKDVFIVFLLVDIETTVATPPFLFLALDLPRPPLFQDSVEKNIIPQVSLASILAKYDGNTTQVQMLLLRFL